MTLDVTTPKGLETLEQERVELSILKSRYPLLTFAHTPKDRESAVDGAIIEGDQWVGLFLSSCRNLTRNQLKGFGNDVILTYKKMHKAVDLAERSCIPVFGYFFLIPERLVMVVKVINDRGGNNAEGSYRNDGNSGDGQWRKSS